MITATRPTTEKNGGGNMVASPSESWMKEFNDASKLADEITAMISGKNSLPPSSSGRETQRHLSTARRKITILRTKLDVLQSLLSALPSKQQMTGKEMNRRQEMVKSLTGKANQMAVALNMSGSANRDSLFGPDNEKDDIMNRTNGLDNQGIVSLQRQVMKEQDEGLEKLEETVTSTKHIALAINEELGLQNRLLDDLDEHVDVTNSRLQRVQRRLAILAKRTKGSCWSLILLVISAVVLIVVVWLLIKYL